MSSSPHSSRRQRVLITGGTGLLALNWACAVRESWDVVLGTHQHTAALEGTSSIRLQLDDPAAIERQIAEIRPDLIVHTAGLTNVDGCEADPGLARTANATLAKNTARAAANRSVRLIHISTDHLFAGDQPLYREEAAPEPLNEYARSKLLAEQSVLDAFPEAIVLRTNFFGWGPARRQSFSDWIIYALRAGNRLTAFDDVYFTPILADHLAHAAHDLSARGAAGLFHLAGDERISKYAFALKVAEHLGISGDLVQRSHVDAAGLCAPRPKDMSLDTAKARQFLGAAPKLVDDYLQALFVQEAQGRRAEIFHAVVD